MKLIAIYKNEEGHMAQGFKNGIPYKITEEDGKFLLNRCSIGFGIGEMHEAVAFFDEEWEGLYSV